MASGPDGDSDGPTIVGIGASAGGLDASTLEELETSREELQSMNEELQTVNQENRHKVEELAQLSSDLQNLLAATDIATVFLDRDLRILRFTPNVGDLFNVRVTDRGRPLSDLTSQLGYTDLADDAARVLRRLAPVEREVRADDGRWYLTRVLAYRGNEDRIEGVVITFVDITTQKEAAEELRAAKDLAEGVIDTLHEPLLVLTPELYVQSANPAFYAHFAVREAETIGRHVYELGNGQWDIPALRVLLEDVLPEDHVFSEFEVAHDFDELGERVMLLNGRRLDDASLILLGIRDITERERSEEEVRRSEERFRLFAEASSDVIWMRDADSLQWEYLSPAFEKVYGYDAASMTQGDDLHGWADVIVPEDRGTALHHMDLVRRGKRVTFEYRIQRPDGEIRWLRNTDFPMRDASGRIRRIGGIGRDITDEKRTDDALRQAKETLEDRVEERTRQVRSLASRLTMAEQEERRRISQVLHDDLQQVLYGVETKVSTTRQRLEDGSNAELTDHLDAALEWLEQAITTTRELTVDISPPILQTEGLADALVWLQRQMRELHGLDVTLDAPHNFLLEDEDLRVLLFQIVRELLFNVKKHAGVDAATVSLDDGSGHVVIHVVDGGRGFDIDEVDARTHGRGLGLVSVRERLDLLGGRLVVRSTPGQGTHIEVHAPASPPAG